MGALQAIHCLSGKKDFFAGCLMHALHAWNTLYIPEIISRRIKPCPEF